MNTITITSGRCQRCGDTASRTSEPWNNQFQCEQGCRCTMQGCCPGETVTTSEPVVPW